RHRASSTTSALHFHPHAAHTHPHPFPTRRSSDLADRAECERAVRLISRHFDQIILDDFFFYNTKSDADIAAKGARSWTQYRLERDRKSTRLNSSHDQISYAVFCLKKKRQGSPQST